ncbi:MAG: XdhC family protein [Verrucomicrobiota bacterium]
MMDFWKTAADELSAGRRVYASFVVANRKGSPGTPVARLLLLEDHRQVGTIGGGIMEQRILEEAKVMLASGEALRPSLRVLRHNKVDTNLASGLICGGEQTNVSLILSGPDDLAVLSEIVHGLDAGVSGLVALSAEGLSFHPSEVVAPYANRFIEKDDGAWAYELNLVNLRRVAIYGGGHCGRALAKLMDGLGYAVAVIEPRVGLFTLEGLPAGVCLIDKEFREAAAAVSFPEKTIAVVMTYSMPTDVEALDGLLDLPFQEIGLMGSAQKVSQIRRTLAEKGRSELQIGRINAPVGLQFDSDTPEEIAVSIAAQILLDRNTKAQW